MIQYEFPKQSQGWRKIVFALILDRKKMAERIVIGEASETRRQLEGKAGDVYFDKTRPLGKLLIDFEGDAKREWNANLMQLYDSYKKNNPFTNERWKMAMPVSEFLRKKIQTGEPSAIYAAIRTWEDYLNCYEISNASNTLMRRLSTLYRPFDDYAHARPWQEEAAAALAKILRTAEGSVELWYPLAKRPFECVVASVSFLPLIAYYLFKIAEWKLVFQTCKACGSTFLARSRHYEICSEGCRKKQALEAKREFDERVKDSRLEQLHESAYFYWYNRLRRYKRGKAADPNKAAAMRMAFEAFRKEAVTRKGMVKRGEMSLADFSSWIVEQQNRVDRLMEDG